MVALLYAADPATTTDGALASGYIGDPDAPLMAGTIEDLTDTLAGGFGYVNVHTVVNPSGEIRGQVFPLDLPEVAGTRFADEDGGVHEANIELIAGAGITLGCNPPDNTNFCPTDPVSRGQMAAFLDRALNLPASNEDKFGDDNGNIFEANINNLAEAGVTLGCNPPSNTDYCPDDYVTRGRMAAFLVRAFGLTDQGTKDFADDDNSVFEADIEKLATAGITIGCNPPANTNFCPDDLVLRNQMASFIARAWLWGS